MVDYKKCVHYDHCVSASYMTECETCDFFYEKPRVGTWELDMLDGQPYQEEEYDYAYVCSVCGSTSIGKRYYCHRCGSYMRGETNDS